MIKEWRLNDENNDGDQKDEKKYIFLEIHMWKDYVSTNYFELCHIRILQSNARSSTV